MHFLPTPFQIHGEQLHTQTVTSHPSQMSTSYGRGKRQTNSKLIAVSSPVKQISVVSQGSFIPHIYFSMPAKQNPAQGNPLKVRKTAGWAKLLMYEPGSGMCLRHTRHSASLTRTGGPGSLGRAQIWQEVLSPQGYRAVPTIKENLQKPAVASDLVLHQKDLNLNI